MRVFVSYARQDRAVVDSLVADLERLGHQAWYDDDLSGGQAWWNEIVRQIQTCDALVFVLSARSAQSEACKIEARYASDLARSIVPLRIDQGVSLRLLPAFLAERQLVDYANRDVDSIIALTRALSTVVPGAPHPDPPPDPPPVPLSYLTGLSARVALAKPMAPDEQWAAMAELRARLVDEELRADVVDLLRALRARADVLAIVAQDIDQLLASLSDNGAPASAAAVIEEDAPPNTAVVPETPLEPYPPRPTPGPLRPPRLSRSRPAPLVALAAGVVLVVVVVLFIAVRDDDDEAAADGTEEVDSGRGTGGDDEEFIGGVQVPATSEWTDTGIELVGGERVEISASGEIGDNPEIPDQRFEPGGAEREDPDKHPGDPYLDFPHAALIGHIGDGEAFEVGYGTVIEDSPPGRLYLGINDGYFDDNSDKYLADITVKGR